MGSASVWCSVWDPTGGAVRGGLLEKVGFGQVRKGIPGERTRAKGSEPLAGNREGLSGE